MLSNKSNGPFVLDDNLLGYFESRGNNRCRKCNDPFKVTQRLIRKSSSGKNRYYHYDCWMALLH